MKSYVEESRANRELKLTLAVLWQINRLARMDEITWEERIALHNIIRPGIGALNNPAYHAPRKKAA